MVDIPPISKNYLSGIENIFRQSVQQHAKKFNDSWQEILDLWIRDGRLLETAFGGEERISQLRRRMMVQRGDDAGHVDELFASNSDFVNSPTVGKPLMPNGHTTSMIQIPIGDEEVSSNIDSYSGQQARKSFSNADLQQRQGRPFRKSKWDYSPALSHRVTHVPVGTPPLENTPRCSEARIISPDSGSGMSWEATSKPEQTKLVLKIGPFTNFKMNTNKKK